MGRVLNHVFGSAAVCHPVLIFMPLARGAACGQSRASACGDEQPGPKVGADTTQKSAMLGVGSGRHRCRGRAASASTVAGTSVAISVASAVAAMFSIPLISVRLLLTASYLELAAFQGRLSCAGAKGASDGWCIVTAVAAGGQHCSAPGGRFLPFQPLVLVYHRTLDPFPRGPVR